MKSVLIRSVLIPSVLVPGVLLPREAAAQARFPEPREIAAQRAGNVIVRGGVVPVWRFPAEVRDPRQQSAGAAGAEAANVAANEAASSKSDPVRLEPAPMQH